MAKTTKNTAAGDAAATAAKSVNITTWVHTIARARGDVGDTLRTIRETTKTSASAKLVTEKLSATPAGQKLLARYEGYVKRGSQRKGTGEKAAA